jgi:hypothetical protein
MPYFLPHVIPDPIPHDDPDLLVDLVSNSFLYKGRKLSKKRRFEYLCRCGNVSVTTQNYLAGKKNPLACRSCSAIESWKDPEYRLPRESHLKSMGASERNRERGREHFVRLWQDEAWKKKTLERLHCEETWKKQSETVRKRLVEDEAFRESLFARARKSQWGDHSDYCDLNGKTIHLKSRGEKRLATLLDEHKVQWHYEMKGFRLQDTGELYYPDFYIQDLDLWIEVKYLLRERDLRKFRILERESSDIRLLAIGYQHINFLEKECESRELKQVILDLFETSQFSRTTTL